MTSTTFQEAIDTPKETMPDIGQWSTVVRREKKIRWKPTSELQQLTPVPCVVQKSSDGQLNIKKAGKKEAKARWNA